MDKDLENRVKDCEDYQKVRNQPTVSPLKFHWLHGKVYKEIMLFILKGKCFSFWWWMPILNCLKCTNVISDYSATIEVLSSVFSTTHGLPKVLVTDNGSQFTSTGFQ